MAEPYNVDMDAKPLSKPPAKPTPARKPKHRNWTWFDDDQQERFLKAQKKKGLDGSSLLSMIFNEYVDREGI